MQQLVLANYSDLLAARQWKLAETFFHHSVSGLVILDRHYNFLRVNPAYAHACRRDIKDFVGYNHFDLYPSDTKEIFDEVVRTKRPFVTFTRAFEFADQPERGVTYWDWTLVPVLDAEGEVEFLVFSLVEVTEKKRADDALRVAASVYLHSSEGMIVMDAGLRILSVNDAFTRISGYTLQSVVGRHPGMFIADLHEQYRQESISHALEQRGQWQGERTFRCQDGRLIAVHLRFNTVSDADGKTERRVALFSDITDKHRSERKIWEQANIDALTRLPNRHRFHDCLEQQLAETRQRGGRLALLLVDLDQFKEINDTLGHDIGDLLLIEVATRLTACSFQQQAVARLGGDEFAIVITRPADLLRLDSLAHEVIAALGTPFNICSETLFISASIGIARFPNDALTVDDLLRHADQAMYAAKNAGRNRHCHFTPALQEALQRKRNLISDLRGALADRQFEIHIQPVVELATGAIGKAEALLRWNHPSRGPVSPAEFIGLAEESGLMIDIGDWVFKQVSAFLRRLHAQGHADLQISINVSPVQFQNDAGLSANWLGHLAGLGLPASSLVVEITEGLLLDVTKEVREKLSALAGAGMQLALDDFGTGYSSLAYLKKFDIDYLKIDRVFISNLESSPDDLALCEAIIVMAHKLGLAVIAEGVETAAQRAVLEKAGCDFMQGYLFSRPLPMAQFEALLGAPRSGASCRSA